MPPRAAPEKFLLKTSLPFDIPAWPNRHPDPSHTCLPHPPCHGTRQPASTRRAAIAADIITAHGRLMLAVPKGAR